MNENLWNNPKVVTFRVDFKKHDPYDLKITLQSLGLRNEITVECDEKQFHGRKAYGQVTLSFYGDTQRDLDLEMIFNFLGDFIEYHTLIVRIQPKQETGI